MVSRQAAEWQLQSELKEQMQGYKRMRQTHKGQVSTTLTAPLGTTGPLCVHHIIICIFIVRCVGGSKALPVLHSSYRTDFERDCAV